MRHGHGLRKLNRTSSHRLAMFRNMAVALLTHEAIKTTLPKAKELRRIVEPLITMGKTPTLANKRLAFARLRDREIVKRLNRTNMPLFMHGWIVVPNNLEQIQYENIAPFQLQYNTGGQKLILVNLTLQAFGAYGEDGRLVHWGPVSGGQDYCKELHGPCKTVTGTFRIIDKGGENCTSSMFPLDTNGGAPMPYCMHFYQGFALHASTLPGYNASHGCVRLFYDDAKWLNESFAKIGTKVIVME